MHKKSTAWLALPLILAIALTGCSSTAATKPGDVKNTSGGSAAPKAPAEKVGTRSNPAPAGTSVTVKDISGNPTYTVVIGAVTMDAGAAITAENQFNSPPKPGMQFIMFPVTFTYVGKETGTPSSDVRINFVSAAGTTHQPSDSFVVIPKDVSSLNEIYPGASATGNIAIEVPTTDAGKGLLTVSNLFGTTKFFLKLA